MSRRPKLNDAFTFRFPEPFQRGQLEVAASMVGVPLSQFVRDASLDRARAVLLENLTQAQHEAGAGGTAPRPASVGEASAPPRGTPTERAAGVGLMADSPKGPDEGGVASATPPASLVGVQS